MSNKTRTNHASARNGDAGLFNVAGTAQRLRASKLFAIGPAEPGPSLRRGALIAVPVGACTLVEFGFGAPTHGALATGALFSGFVAFDAPARPRAGWQAAVAPVVGVAAAIGILSSQSAVLAVLAMVVCGLLAGFLYSVSLRLAIYGLAVTLSLLVAQGLFLPQHYVPEALAYVTAGALLQVLWSLIIWVTVDREGEDAASGWDTRSAIRNLKENLTLSSATCRHAIRFAVALAVGVGLYRAFDFDNHGFWIPLTILFVMRPERDETQRRLWLRAIGTVLGLVVATALAEVIGDRGILIAIVLTVAAALCFGLLTVQYALFTAAVTTYVVLLADTLGESALTADAQRAAGTALGILIAYLAFALWPTPGVAKARDPADPIPRQ